MKKRMNSLLPKALGACALLSAAQSQAFLDQGSFYLVPSIGYHITDIQDHYDKIEKKGLYNIDYDDDMNYGIAFGFQTTPYTAVELAYNYTKFDMTAKPKAGGAEMTDSTDFHYVHIDALYYFNNIYENDFSFYIPIGLGYGKTDPKLKKEVGAKGLEDTLFNFGVGVQYMFGEHFGLRGDVRGLYGFSQENFDGLVQVGAVFRFGVPVPVGMSDDNIKSADIQFKLNSTQVVNPNDPDILALVDALQNNNNANIRILAYSDRSGNSAYNMKLSQRRADSLKKILIEKYGVDESRIFTKAFGDQDGTSRGRHAIALLEY